jgi:replicative DNA helicase
MADGSDMARVHGFGQKREGEADKQPHNLSAEAAILGAILFNNQDLDRIREIVRADDFYAVAHQKIFHRAMILIEAGFTADGVIMHEWAEQTPEVRDIGGANYLIDLLESAAFGAELTDYCVMVRNSAARRMLISTGQLMQDSGRHPKEGTNPSEWLEEARDSLQAIEDMHLRGSKWEAASESSVRVYAQMEDIVQNGKPGQVRGLRSGLPELDKRIGGLVPGRLIVLAGRPGMGKSGVASNIAASVAADRADHGDGNNVVGFFSLEMEKSDYDIRLISSLAHKTGAGRVEYQDAGNGSLGINQLAILREGRNAIPDTLYCDDTGALSVGDIAARARALKRSAGRLDLIVIDYLQIMNLMFRPGESEAAALGRTTSALKQLAKDLNVPIILLSQLSRQCEMRENKRPQLADLRGSGSIEQDADIVIFCYRDEYYLAKSEPPHGASGSETEKKWMQWWSDISDAKGKIELNAAKNRHGQVGRIVAHYDAGTDCLVTSKSELEQLEEQLV